MKNAVRLSMPNIITKSVWTPLSLGSYLAAWWVTDHLANITLSGSQVSSWLDMKAGYDAVQAVAASRPLYSATSWAGLYPGITFDGIDDELTCTDAVLLAALPDGAEPCEMWALVDQTSDPSDVTQRYYMAYGSSQNVARRLGRTVLSGENRVFGLVGTSASAIQVAGPTVPYNGRHVSRLKIEATQTTAFMDGVANPPGAGVPASDVARVRLGAAANAPAAAFGKGVMREAIMIIGNLPDNEATNLLAYLQSRR